MNRKWILAFGGLLIFLAFIPIPSSLLALESNQSEPQLELVDVSGEIDLAEWNSILKEIDKELQDTLPDFSLTKIFADLKNGEIDLQTETLFSILMKGIFTEVVSNAPLIAKLLALAILCAIINQLQHAFSGNISKLAQMIVYFVLLSIAISSFKIALDTATNAIDQMVSFMQVALPVMYTLLLAMGNITSAALFKPVVLGSLAFLASVIKNIVLPLFFLSIVLRLFNQISKEFKLTKLASLLEFFGKVSIGVVMTVFIGVMTTQGVTGGVADGVALRTAKYSADLIPVVGKFFKDAVELVVGSGLLIKNALGIVSMLGVVLLTLGPVVKIIAMMFTFKISAALVEPIGEKELADSLQDMSKGLLYIFTALASVSVMFFIAITIVIGTGSLSVMLR